MQHSLPINPSGLHGGKKEKLREEPGMGSSRFGAEVFYSFLKAQKACSGCQKDFFDSLSCPSDCPGSSCFAKSYRDFS